MKTVIAALNSKFIHTSIALRYISKYAEKYGVKIETAEYTINNQPEKIVASLFEKKADIYGFSLYIFNKEETLKIIKDLKKIIPESIIFCGGPEASEDCKQLLFQCPEIDFLIRGEGEQADLDFLKTAETNNIDKEKIKKAFPKNTSFILDGKFYETEKLPLIEPLDKIPFPYDKEELSVLKDRILYYESSRGCPFNCSYCMSSLDKKVRSFSLERVFNDICAFINAEVRLVKFIDRTFNFNKKRTYDILSYIIEKDKGKTEFHFEISLWLLSDKTLKLLKKARKGLFRFEIGVQSANKKTLDAINRKNDIFDYVDTFEKLKATNVHIHTDLIAGLPFETYESFLSSLDKTYNLGGDVLQLGFLKVLHGTQISFQKEFGITATERTPYEILKNNWISYEELLKLKKAEEILELLYNSNLMKNSFDFAVKHIFDKKVSSLLLYLSKKAEETDFFELPKKPRDLFEFFNCTIESIADKKTSKIFSEHLTYDYFLTGNYSGNENFLSASPDFEAAKTLLHFPNEIKEKIPECLKNEFSRIEPKKWYRKIKVLPFNFGKSRVLTVFLYMSETCVFNIDENLTEKMKKLQK